jgi:hypothetical protein
VRKERRTRREISRKEGRKEGRKEKYQGRKDPCSNLKTAS